MCLFKDHAVKTYAEYKDFHTFSNSGEGTAKLGYILEGMGAIPERGKIFLSSPYRPDRL
jgi:hypothetical protein